MKTTLIIVFFAVVCLHSTLSSRTIRYSRSFRKHSKPPASKPTTIKKPLTSSESTIAKPASTPLAEIPLIKSDKELKITGENGEISVDDIVLYNDDVFKTGRLEIQLSQSNIYVNGNLVAKPDPRDNINLTNRTINLQDITDFQMTILHGGFFTFKNNKQGDTFYF